MQTRPNVPMMGGDLQIATPKPIRDFQIPPFPFALSLFRVFAILLLLLACLPANAADSTKLIVVVANRLLLSDIDDPSLPTIHKIVQEGRVGLISPNCAGAKTEGSVLLTAGAGVGCRGGGFVDDVYGAGEVLPSGLTAADEYATRTGYAAGDSSGVFLALPLAQRANVDIAGVRLGALADALHKAGKKTASVGCPGGRESGSPAVRQIGNPAVLAMDSRGQIDYADFRFVPAKGDSCGLLSDVNLLSRRVSLALERADYVIVDFGDTTSLDNMKVSLSDKAYTAHREAALRGLDRLLKNLLADSGVGLVLVSFSPPSPDEWNRLTPIVISTRDTKPGLLTSLTTRTRGLIAASDFAPTILGMMGVSVDQSMLGQKAAGASGTSELASLHVMEKRVVANESLVWPILLFLAFTGALAFFVTSVLVAFSLPISRKISGLLKACLMIGAASPLAMLLAVIAPAGVVGYASGLGVSLVVLVPGALAIGWLLSRVGSSISLPVRVVYAVTVVVLMFDAALGCPLCKFSLPSSYQITAMRFYGIGNEYAGILIAMSAAACLFADLRVRKWAVVLVGALVVSVLGVGSLGANYGATIAAIVTFGLLGTAIWRGGFGTRHVAAWLVIAFALVAGLAFVDLKMAGAAASHAGRATGLAEKIGAGYLFELVSRKMMLNIRLAGTKQSIWVTMSFMPFLALWFWGVQAKVLKTLGKDPSLVAGLKASLIGAAVAFLFNDSGVVMASIMIAMTVLVLVYSLLERPEGGACRE